ncbi:hypothetical protein HPP92_013922 [Vanilla planifolia]|uniref:Uncharacterized protein n=1 Tax=Vanilla planifolia TaxID=51239 RepID=A0A835QPB4_VANPL|nr:hypothetical protein HPP92_013922 [Vanilla planifolia]
MPAYTWKKIKIADGLLSGLCSKPGGSLVVQTGFPTSLADLIVKNHVRRKKSSLKSKRKALLSSDLAFASTTEAKSDRGSSLMENEGLSGCNSVQNSISSNRKVGYGSNFRFLPGMVILSVVLVVIGNKAVVIGITISAFCLLILELSGFRAFWFLNLCDDRKKRMNSVIGISDFGGREWASPIREIGIQARIDSSVSVAKYDDGNGSSLKGDGIVTNKVCECSSKSKAKKLFRRFFSKKLRRAGEGGTASCSIEANGVQLTDHKELLMQEEEGDSDTEILSFRTCYGELDDGKDEYVTHRYLEVNRLRRFAVLVFFVVVLFGLVKGKAVALFLALSWCFVFRFIELISFWSKSSL